LCHAAHRPESVGGSIAAEPTSGAMQPTVLAARPFSGSSARHDSQSNPLPHRTTRSARSSHPLCTAPSPACSIVVCPCTHSCTTAVLSLRSPARAYVVQSVQSGGSTRGSSTMYPFWHQPAFLTLHSGLGQHHPVSWRPEDIKKHSDTRQTTVLAAHS
jgi:hypothetical protein